MLVAIFKLKKRTFSKLIGKQWPRSPVFSKVGVVDRPLYKKRISVGVK